MIGLFRKKNKGTKRIGIMGSYQEWCKWVSSNPNIKVFNRLCCAWIEGGWECEARFLTNKSHVTGFWFDEIRLLPGFKASNYKEILENIGITKDGPLNEVA